MSGKKVPPARRASVWLIALLIVLFGDSARAVPAKLGDLDSDGVLTVLDLTRLNAHVSGTATIASPLAVYADVNQDGFVNDVDSQALVRGILGVEDTAALPLASLRETSPLAGEGGVAVTREAIVRFTMPLALTTVLTTYDANTQTTGHLYAEAGGRKLLTRVELSGDRLKATLFFLEPLPASSRVTVTFDGTGVLDLLDRPIDTDGDGAPGGELTFVYDTVPISPVPGTGVIGQIFASEVVAGVAQDRPLAGVTITVDGAEQELRTTTDAQGRFTLSPCPAGRFFVFIDGRTATNNVPAGAYYAFVGKAWEALPGKANNLAAGTGVIYLPLIPSGTLQAVSATVDTKITFPPSVLAQNPALAGVEIDVPANSLFADNGARGGTVGIAPVSPDRLPEPLPPGLEFPLVITIQTDGATNFDRPVPVKFPNLPDPVTGKKLAPGEKSALCSFNHDTGVWEIQGPMTVTADGSHVVSDVGVGVRQPGWHGANPSSGGGGPPPPPPPPPCSNPISCCNNSDGSQKTLGQLQKQRAMCMTSGGAGIGAALIGGTAVQAACSLIPNPIAKFICGRGRNAGQNAGLKQAIGDTDACLKATDDCIFKAIDDGVAVVKDGKVNIAKLFTQVAPQAAQGSETETLLYELMDVFTRSSEIEEQIYAKLGNVQTPDELTAPQQEEVSHLIQQHAGIFGGISPEAFYRPRVLRLNNLIRSIQTAENLFISERGFYLLENHETGAVLRAKTAISGGMDGLFLMPNARYRLKRYFPTTKVLIDTSFVSDSAGLNTVIAGGGFQVSDSLDTDVDGLTDVAEAVIGTDFADPDTDSDGISDGIEIGAGTDALSGLAVATGVIATVDTAGFARDLVALNQLSVVADGDAGVSVFDVSSTLNPVRVAQVDTPGTAKAVAIGGSLVAAADGASGLAVVSVAIPAEAQKIGQHQFGSSAEAVVVAGSIAYVGLASGQIAVVDMQAGLELERLNVASSTIYDLAISGTILYAVTEGRLHAIPLTGDAFTVAASVNFSGGTAAGGRRPRLFVGGGLAYVTYNRGYYLFGLANPAQPTFIRQQSTAQFGWNQLVPNGSGLALASVGANGIDDVSLYNLNPGGTGFAFQTTFPTPGLAEAVAIYNGLGFVADGASGLSIVNYLAYDNLRQPPTIALSTNFGTTQAEEGKLVSAAATVTDDVQVRNVEFYVDGLLAVTDGNFPFEHPFVTPLRTPTKTSFTLRAKATDTGGNSTWSDTLTINLVPDATPPRVTRFNPANGSYVGKLRALTVSFSEPIQPATLNDTSIALLSAGADRIFGNADDQTVTPDNGISYLESTRSAVLNFSTDLPPGLYRLTAKAPVADLAGNALAAPVAAAFRVFSFIDTDRDGVPDDLEAALGLNPNSNDTDRDGIRDGSEDFDNDGLGNAAEVAFGLDATKRDTDGNGINDGDEDPDLDGMTNRFEGQNGTDPLLADTDGDGRDDGSEVADGTSPLSPTGNTLTTRSAVATFLNALSEVGASGFPIVVHSRPASFLNALSEVGAPGFQISVHSPSVSFLNALGEVGTPGFQISIHSAPASYLNSVAGGLAPATVVQFFTGSVSYRNGPPPPAFTNLEASNGTPASSSSLDPAPATTSTPQNP